MNESDAQHDLVAGLRQGIPEAQIRLLDLYGEPLVRFLVHVCRADVVEAEDLAVEALYRAIEHIDSFGDSVGKSHHGFRNWLFTIARNLWRDRMRQGPSVTRLEDLESVGVPSPDIEPDLSSPKTRAVREALGTLPDSQRLTLILHYGGMPLTEVAEVLGARPGTVRQWKRRGLTAIARVLLGHPALACMAEEMEK